MSKKDEQTEIRQEDSWHRLRKNLSKNPCWEEKLKGRVGQKIGNSLEFDFVVPPPHSCVGL